MELESYFDFLAQDDIRVKGTRIGIETILYDYIHRGQSPEAIAACYPSLTLEQVYATITYYLPKEIKEGGREGGGRDGGSPDRPPRRRAQPLRHGVTRACPYARY